MDAFLFSQTQVFFKVHKLHCKMECLRFLLCFSFHRSRRRRFRRRRHRTTSNWRIHRALHRSQRSHSQMRQILQFRQIGQHQIQRIHNDPAINAQHNQQRPNHNRQHIVRKDQIVYDRKEDQTQTPDQREHGETPQPRYDAFFVLFAQGNHQIDADRQHNKAAQHGKQREDHQQISNWRRRRGVFRLCSLIARWMREYWLLTVTIADIHEFVRYYEISVVCGSGRCHHQTVHIKDARRNGKHSDCL